MTAIFTAVLIISLQATVVAAVVVFIKKAFKAKINTRISYLLWVLVLFRLLFPILPSSPLSIFNAANLDYGNKISQLVNPILNARIIQSASPSISENNMKSDVIALTRTNNLYRNSNAPTESETSNSSQKSSPQNTLTFLSYIWAAGVLLVTVYLFLINVIFSLRIKVMNIIEPPKILLEKLKLATCIHRPVKFVESVEVAFPCVFGILNPVIIFPKGLLGKTDNNTLSHVLSHEFAHIKRCDLGITWLVSIICSIHWFNPLLWYCSKLIKQDQELCADAYVMYHLTEDDILGYGQTLLSIVRSTRRQPFALMTAGITENKSTIKQRIKNISSFSKKKHRLTFIGIMLVLAAGIVLCTSGINYPKTAEESMKFSDNIMMSFTSNNANNPKSFELQVHNYNKLAINNCNIEIYDGNPYKSGSRLIFSSNNFRVAGEKYKSFNLGVIDYNSAYIKFNYRIGFSFSKLNRGEQSGDIQIFDKTLKINGWSAASDTEVDSFIKENGLRPIAITKIYGFYTIVIFENGNSSGYYELYKDTKSDALRSRKVFGYFPNIAEQPVQMLGGTASGNYPFFNFKINSPAILGLGDKIEIKTTNGTLTTHVSGQAAHTVETRGYGNIGKILIYDNNNKLIYDGEKALFENVNFKYDDPSYSKVVNEKGFKIVNQSSKNIEINFTQGMFPKEYVIAYKSGDIDLKIPLFTFDNTTAYLKAIVESNESPDYLNALIYFVHHIDNKPGNILSGNYVNFEENDRHSFTNKVMVQKDVSSSDFGILKNTASLRSSGPGDQIGIYLDRSMVEKTNGNFTVTFEGLNLISYVPS